MVAAAGAQTLKLLAHQLALNVIEKQAHDFDELASLSF
jgi:hypothetical protein